MLGDQIAHPDFYGDPPAHVIEKGDVVMRFCMCDRGSSLRELIEKREYKANLTFAAQLKHIKSMPVETWPELIDNIFKFYSKR